MHGIGASWHIWLKILIIDIRKMNGTRCSQNTSWVNPEFDQHDLFLKSRSQQPIWTQSSSLTTLKRFSSFARQSWRFRESFFFQSSNDSIRLFNFSTMAASRPKKNETKRMLNESETENISRNTWSQSDNGRKQQHELRCAETMFQQMKFKSDSKNGSRKKQNNSLSLTFMNNKIPPEITLLRWKLKKYHKNQKLWPNLITTLHEETWMSLSLISQFKDWKRWLSMENFFKLQATVESLEKFRWIVDE